MRACVTLLVLSGSLGLSTEVGGGASAGEEAAEHGLQEGVEDDLGTATALLVVFHEKRND